MENNAARKLKQVPVGYLRVGVDPHKKKHVAVNMTEDWAKRLRERPAHANPLTGKEIMGAAVNKLLRIGFVLAKKQTFYQLPRVPQLVS